MTLLRRERDSNRRSLSSESARARLAAGGSRIRTSGPPPGFGARLRWPNDAESDVAHLSTAIFLREGLKLRIRLPPAKSRVGPPKTRLFPKHGVSSSEGLATDSHTAAIK